MDKKIIKSIIFSKQTVLRLVIFAITFTLLYIFSVNNTQNSVNIGLIFMLTIILMFSVSLICFLLAYFCGQKYRYYKRKRNIVPIKRVVELKDAKKINTIQRIWNKLFRIKYIVSDSLSKVIASLDIITDYRGKKAQIQMSENPEYRSDLEHNEIVIAPSKGLKSAYYTNGPDDLYRYFQEKNIPYHITICNSSDDFDRIILNDTAAVLWLFGHGNIGGYQAGNHDIIRYSKYQEEPYVSHRKKAVYQLHCNSKNPYHPNPLSRILVDGWDFREKGVTQPADNKAFVRFAIENKDEFPGIWETV